MRFFLATVLCILSVQAFNPIKNFGVKFSKMPSHVDPNGKLVFDFCTGDRTAKIAQNSHQSVYFTLRRTDDIFKGLTQQKSFIHQFLPGSFYMKPIEQKSPGCYKVFLDMSEVQHYKIVYETPIYKLVSNYVKTTAETRVTGDSSYFDFDNPNDYELMHVDPTHRFEIAPGVSIDDMDNALKLKLIDHKHANDKKKERHEGRYQFGGQENLAYMDLDKNQREYVKRYSYIQDKLKGQKDHIWSPFYIPEQPHQPTEVLPSAAERQSAPVRSNPDRHSDGIDPIEVLGGRVHGGPTDPASRNNMELDPSSEISNPDNVGQSNIGRVKIGRIKTGRKSKYLRDDTDSAAQYNMHGRSD